MGDGVSDLIKINRMNIILLMESTTSTRVLVRTTGTSTSRQCTLQYTVILTVLYSILPVVRKYGTQGTVYRETMRSSQLAHYHYQGSCWGSVPSHSPVDARQRT